jgi:hypothetical protein
MFESVTKASCQIIESCWTKERAPVDTYIMGLATSIRERNDYGEQVHIIVPHISTMQKLIILCLYIHAYLLVWEFIHFHIFCGLYCTCAL